MDSSQVSALCEAFFRMNWESGLAGASAALVSSGWRLASQVGNRDEYRDDSGLIADLYQADGILNSIEVTVEAFVETDCLDELEYEDMVDRFYALFNEASAAVAQTLGKPKFSDGRAARGFPDDQDAEWVSLWEAPTCRLMIQQKHEDRELPFRICIVVAPRRTKASADRPTTRTS